MSNADLRGRFVWHELATTDTAGAGAFYPKVVSWKTQPWEKDASYTLLMGAKGPNGGVMALGTDGGAAPHWTPYIGTPDIAATVEAAKKLGATVLKDVSEVASAGKYAVLKDPQGATFALYTPAPGTPGSSGGPEVGDFSWHELATTDFEAALHFYQQLFGWDKGPVHEMGGGMKYQLFHHAGREVGGIFNGDSMGMSPSWMCYVRVDDVGKAANAAKAAGGRVLNGPMEVPGGDWVAQVMDPQGATFAVHERKAAAAAAKPAAKPAAVAKPATKPANSLPDVKPAAAAKPAAPAPAKPAAAAPAAKPAAAAAKPAARKAPAKKAAAKKAAKKRPGKKAAGKKKAAKRPAAKKAKKSAAKKAAKKSKSKSARRPAGKKARKHRKHR